MTRSRILAFYQILKMAGNWPVLAIRQRQAYHSPALEAQLKEHQIPYQVQWTESGGGSEVRKRVEAVNRWYQHDWRMIDNKIRSSIVEGIAQHSGTKPPFLKRQP